MKPRQVLNLFGVIAALVVAPAFMFGGCSSSKIGGTDSSVGGVDAIAGVDAGAKDAALETAALDSAALDSAALDGGGGVPQQCLTSFVNPFAALTPYWANWSSSSCSSVAAANGSLVLTQNEPCSSASPNAIAGLAPPNVLCGDFDVQVYYAVTGLVAGVTGGIFASMRANDPTVTTNGMTIERYAAGYLPPSSQSYQNYKSYTTNQGEDVTSVLVPTTDVTGRLRLTRAGTTVKSYYWKTGAPDGQWLLVNTATLTNTPWLLVLYEGDNSAANAGPAASYSVTFSNLQVTSPGPTDAGTGIGPLADSGASDAPDTAIAADANAVDAPVGSDAIGGTGGSSNTGGAGQGGVTTGGTAGTGGVGGTGGATTCTPVALTDTVYGHWDQLGNSLATDGTNVYWADALTGNLTVRLNRVPVAGGTAVTMAYEEAIGFGLNTYYDVLAVDSTNVYFDPYYISGGGEISPLWAIPKGAGPAPQTNGTAMCDPSWVSVNGPCPATQYGGGTLLTASQLAGRGYTLISTGKELCYMQQMGNSQTELRCVPVAGGDPVTLVKSPPIFRPSPLATDGTNIFYLANGTAVDIMSVPIAGGTPVKVGSYESSGSTACLFFLANAGYLYWAPTYGSGKDTIMKMSTSGGTPQLLTSNQIMNVHGTAYPATDGKNLYWWGSGIDNIPQIMKVSVNGGTPTVVVKETTAPNGISVVVDDTSIYWTHPPYMYKCPK